MTETPDPPRRLGTRVAVGAIWMFAMRGSVQVLGLISTVVLARLLIPEDFGIVALASAYIAILEGITALPLTHALIRFRDADRQYYDTAWTLEVARAVAIAGLMVATAPLVAAWMDEPRLTAVITVLALPPLLEGFVNPRFVDFDKHLEFSRPMILRLVTKASAVVCAIVVAVWLRSYWALIAGTLVSVSIRLPATYVLKPYWPRFSLSRVRKLFGFSAWISGARIVGSIRTQMDKFIVGGVLNTSLLGTYHMGQEIAQAPMRDVVAPLKRAFYPGFTMMADDLAKLRANALELSSILLSMSLPLGVGLALVADEFVIVVLSEKWVLVIPFIQYMAPAYVLLAGTAVSDAIIMARLATHLIFLRECINLVLRLSMIAVALYAFGFDSLPATLALTALTAVALQLLFFRRVAGIRLHQPFTVAWRSFASAAVMAIVVLGVAATGLGQTSVAASLGLKVTLGALTYVGTHLLLWQFTGRPVGLETRVFDLLATTAAAYRRNGWAFRPAPGQK